MSHLDREYLYAFSQERIQEEGGFQYYFLSAQSAGKKYHPISLEFKLGRAWPD